MSEMSVARADIVILTSSEHVSSQLSVEYSTTVLTQPTETLCDL